MERRKLSAADIYCKFAAQLDEDGFRLYRAAQRITGFQPYDAFPYEDNRGAFEAADGHTFLRYLEAAHFDAVTWEIVPGTTYERAILGKVDTTTPEYRAFREAICADALGPMGLGYLLKTKEK
ncbi:hypothetical protein, partial [Dysosmobacter sp.]|uniref:hypothetical protein n=1 Tax=Dysosmobacter sp. TaxID=2591382 RepID=UPI003AB3C1B4